MRPTTTINYSDIGSVFKSEQYREVVEPVGFAQSMGNAGLSLVIEILECCSSKGQDSATSPSQMENLSRVEHCNHLKLRESQSLNPI